MGGEVTPPPAASFQAVEHNRAIAAGGAFTGESESVKERGGVGSIRLEDVVGGEASSDGVSQLGDEDDLSLPDLFAE
jgi:hypothetical protein